MIHTKYEVKNGVAVLKLDSPNSKVNTLNVETMTEVKEAMNKIANDPNVHSSVLISGKAIVPESFIGFTSLLIKLSCRETNLLYSWS